MRDRKWLRLLGVMLGVVGVGGWCLWKWGLPTHGTESVGWLRAQLGGSNRAVASTGDGESAAGAEEGVGVDEELGWDEDLGKDGYLVWRPKLALQGPWTDSARALTGGVKLLEELPHGFCHPRIQEMLMELFTEESLTVKALERVIEDDPALVRAVLLPPFKSAYFKTPEIDLYAPRDEKKEDKSGAPGKEHPLKRAEARVDLEGAEARGTVGSEGGADGPRGGGAGQG